jgi:hypothetical protein
MQVVDSENIIATTNPSVLAWLEEKGINGKHMDYMRPVDLLHKNVYGYVPYWLATFATKVCEVDLPFLSPEDRDRLRRGLLTIQEMDAAGAQLVTYQIRRI